MTEKTKDSIRVFSTMFLGLVILFSFVALAKTGLYSKITEFYWQIFVLSILLGSLIANIRIDTLNHNDRESFPRIGFSAIISGIIILIGNGFIACSSLLPFLETPISLIGNIISLAGLYFLSTIIAGLFIVAGKTLIKTINS